jgi:hypothetical protein
MAQRVTQVVIEKVSQTHPVLHLTKFYIEKIIPFTPPKKNKAIVCINT